MSQPFSRFLHPFDIAHPTPEPEVTRAILAFWASDKPAGRGQAAAARARTFEAGLEQFPPMQ